MFWNADQKRKEAERSCNVFQGAGGTLVIIFRELGDMLLFRELGSTVRITNLFWASRGAHYV